MKMIFTLIVLWTAAGALLVAAPVSASLKVDGLTCSLCNRSVHEAVTKLDFIGTVAADLANASFTLTFKPGQEIRLDRIARAVQEAGFSVGALTLRLQVAGLQIQEGLHFPISGAYLHFVEMRPQTLDGVVEVQLVDQIFLAASDRSRWAARVSAECYRTGRPAACCPIPDNGASSRIYHVTR